MHLLPLQHTFTLCLASMNLVYSAPYFKIIIVIKADIPNEIISFTFSAVAEKYIFSIWRLLVMSQSKYTVNNLVQFTFLMNIVTYFLNE